MAPVEVWRFRRDLYVAFWRSSSEDAGMTRRNARIDSFVLDALGFDGPRSNPRRRAPRDPRPSAPYNPSADPWAVQRAVIAEHRMHAAAARQQARYDADALEVAEYHDAEAERLEAELAAGRGRKKRKNPVDHALVGFDEVMDEDDEDEDDEDDEDEDDE
jgi:ribosome assembly protein YihI (activator of Der GTPase)